ncbi:MAG TPA: VIT domain-containing protein [Phycisphaerae bacterium]|nr:VIT domain-containing protein [Phycisphaerae bacterium]HRY68940.1 VIT domain-containing protein [Phycisphaerae bacterium]HSA25767.1 VIT domain-containing protein [Phycisphaerae bacterium]
MKGTRRIEWLFLLLACGSFSLVLSGGGCSEGPRFGAAVGLPVQVLKGSPRSHSAKGAAGIPEAPPGSLPSPEEELWVIQRPEESVIEAAEGQPGTGALMAKMPGDKEIPLPLKHTDVKAAISGYIATVDVTQQYHNPHEGKIEAVYVFPLPHNAAVNEFVMTVGQRKIRGIIRDRKEAEQIYREARDQGYVASLLTQERPNVFTQKVANIEAGKAIDINIRYFNTLAYLDGGYEFVFPMVVGPRFNPPGSTDGVGSAPRGQPGRSGQRTEVTYLKPGERSGHDIAVCVEIDAGVAIEQIECLSHVVAVHRGGPEKATVALSNLDAIPNKDFVLRYRVAGGTVKSAMLTHQDQRGGFFTLMVYPPEQLAALKRKPMEMIFVLDCSGSMNGQPIAQVKNAIERALHRMEPGDSFQMIRFSNNASALGPKPLEATPANVARGLRYLRGLEGEGGTMVIEGVKAALDFPHDPGRLRFVCLMTDGFIGNEAEIIAETHKRLGASRIFSFGVGEAPNRYFMEGMAKVGRGAVAYLSLKDSASRVMDAFFERISHPAMTDLQIDWGELRVTDVYPEQVPDLFVGRPVVVTGRFTGAGGPNVRITGQVGGESRDITVPTHLGEASARHPALAAVWARMKIADLSDWATSEPAKTRIDQIRSLALEYGLMSAYTAFVAVDSLTRTAGNHGTTVQVPVPVPEGVRYETAVEGAERGTGRSDPVASDRDVQRIP